MNSPQTDFERELKAMLAVDPSPDLHVWIRARAFAAPVPRRRWLVPAFALAGTAAAVAVMLMIGFAPTDAPAPTKVVVKVSRPPEAKRIEPAIPELHPSTPPRVKPRLIAIVAAPPVAAPIETELSAGPIELEPMTVQPVPAPPVLSFARLEPKNIEPLELTVRNLGVSQ